ncbi:family 16 glycosylhydrolase [Geofilum rhodophaeum]|uniref:family 16 glycosylhydrolase n=1 Tax=Geofilum rhodophaeum TaxID=1965019 RepID=UPI000B5269A6|nr:family 16 glycosylhydrolase [Geofilum rhodophaeum]
MKNYRWLFSSLLLIWTFGAQAQYQLVWEEDFEGTSLHTDVWNYETGVGVWNTGANAELQHYRAENVAVGPDGEGNSALIITARRENFNGYDFTSGRIQTRGKVGVKYGKIEARIKLPVLENGLWPAFWMLGTQNGWPASGEIDILEAGHAEGIANSQQDRTLNGALHWQHEGNYAGYGPQWTAPEGTNLYDYNTFTLIWTPSTIQMFLNDLETPYFEMDISGTDAEEFRDWPHYFVLNLAVGGSFPGITNPTAITAPFPAQMFVDYIRVYQREGEGELLVSPPTTPPTGETFGIFTEHPNIAEHFVLDDLVTTLQIWEGSLQPLEDAPLYEGAEALVFRAPAARTWFGFGLNAANGLDLSHFAGGYLHLALRTSSSDNFWIGLGDHNGKEGRIAFNYGSDPFGFQRNGTWQRISIPVAHLLGGGLDMSNLSNVFMLGGEGAVADLLLDDVYFSTSASVLEHPALNGDRDAPLVLPENKIEADHYGIYTENPNVAASLLIDDLDGHIYIWENTLRALTTKPYDGEEVLAFASQGSAGWWGFGVHDDEAADLSHFADGYLHFSVKSASTESFRIEISGANGSKGHVDFLAGNDPSGFVRDGVWHQVGFPLASLVADGLDLSAVPVPFAVTQAGSSTSIGDVAFDDIVYSLHAEAPVNTNLYQGGDEEEPEPDRWAMWTGDGGVAQVVYGGDQEAAVSIAEAGWADHSVQLFIDGLTLPDGDYLLTFKAKALDDRNINVNVGKGLEADPWFVAFMDQETFALTTQWQSFSHTFTKHNAYNDGKLVFEMGDIPGSTTLKTSVFLDEVLLTPLVPTSFAAAEVLEGKVLRNPVKDVLEVQCAPDQQLELYNIHGQLVRWQLSVGSVSVLPVGDLPRGLYVLHVAGVAHKVVLH